jgi:hypothetical protein
MVCMSEPTRATPRYQRSSGGLVGAMVVTVLFVLAFAGIRALTRDDPVTEAQTVDYQVQVKAGRADGKLALWAPLSLPTGWRATSASYSTGMAPTWHLGLLTDGGKYVGVEESRQSVDDIVSQHVDANAEKGPEVSVGGHTWQVYTDRTGDYALVRTSGSAETTDTLLVVGSAPDAQVRSLAARLTDGK